MSKTESQALVNEMPDVGAQVAPAVSAEPSRDPGVQFSEPSFEGSPMVRAMKRFLTSGRDWNLLDANTRDHVFCNAFCAIGIFNCVIFGIYHASLNNVQHASIISVLAVVLAGLMIYLRRNLNVKRVSSLMLSLVFGYFVYLMFIGGTDKTGPYWFAIFPIVIFFAKGRNAGVIGTLSFLAVMVGLIVAQANGVVETALTTSALVLSAVSLTVVSLIVFIYEHFKTVIETALRLSEQAQRHMAGHDNLTGLPNRKLLSDRFSVALAAAKRHEGRMAVLFVDLDDFKPINDRLGHDVGDATLKEVARRLGASFREMDTVARLGGDEFIVLLPEVKNLASVAKLAETCVSIVGRDMEIDGELFATGASIGIALYPDHGLNFETLLSRADDAMYAAKSAGKNRCAVAC